MNKYSLSIKWKFNEEFESWNMIIISDDSKEHVTEVIKNYQKKTTLLHLLLLLPLLPQR